MPLTDNYIFELDDNVTRKPVSYKNRLGVTISADLYLPKDFGESDEHAAIVVGAPYGGVKEQGPGIYAQNLAGTPSPKRTATRSSTRSPSSATPSSRAARRC